MIEWYVGVKNVTYFDSFGVKNIPKEIWKFIGMENSRIEAYDSMMCGDFCIGFIDFMLKGKIESLYKFIFS